MARLESFNFSRPNDPLSAPFSLMMLQLLNMTLNKCEVNEAKAYECDPDGTRKYIWKYITKSAAESALFEAAASGDTGLTKWLINLGTNVNAVPNGNGVTPLHVAAQNGHTEAAQALVDAKALLNAKDKWLWSPLHYCAWKGQTGPCRVLANAGAAIDPQADDARSPLHRAAEGGFTNIVKILLDKGANQNLRDNWQWTPLFYSARGGHLSVCTLLVDKGADVNARSNVSGWWYGTPLSWANSNGNKSVQDYLKSKGGKI